MLEDFNFMLCVNILGDLNFVMFLCPYVQHIMLGDLNFVCLCVHMFGDLLCFCVHMLGYLTFVSFLCPYVGGFELCFVPVSICWGTCYVFVFVCLGT